MVEWQAEGEKERLDHSDDEKVAFVSPTPIVLHQIWYLGSPSSSLPWHCLQLLDISYNSLAGPELARMLQYTQTLQRLKVACCGLTKFIFEPHTGLPEALHGERSKLGGLTVFTCGDITLHYTALTGLTEASFSRNSLGGDGVYLLLEALPRARLARLNVSGTCSNSQQFSGVMEEPVVVEFFREVRFTVCLLCGVTAYWSSLEPCGANHSLLSV